MFRCNRPSSLLPSSLQRTDWRWRGEHHRPLVLTITTNNHQPDLFATLALPITSLRPLIVNGPKTIGQQKI